MACPFEVQETEVVAVIGMSGSGVTVIAGVAPQVVARLTTPSDVVVLCQKACAGRPGGGGVRPSTSVVRMFGADVPPTTAGLA
ncbi:MAG: hypothetical protein EDX89_01815 [Acidobacteria bacterium]|nr:MAG: hypothetical protein EDX89_01815 [Acidobacteriota bacterium]